MSMNEYNVPSTFSMGASQDYDDSNPGDFAHTAGSVAVASLADFGVSVYNSLNLGNWMGDDADTYDFLNGLGMDNVADKYLEHKDLVQGISFIGGAFVPGGAAIKLSRAGRSGLSATNYLNPKAMSANTHKLQELIKDGKKATNEYKKLRFSAIRQGVAQGAVDNVAVEFAILGTMNEHPWMEDYMDDLPASMALSLGLGSAIGSVVDYASTAYTIRNAASRAVQETEQPVIDAVGTRFAAADPITRVHEAKASLDRVDMIIQSDAMSQGTKDFAAQRKVALEGEIGKTVRALADNLGQPLPKTDAEGMMKALEDMISTPEFMGVADIKFFKPDKLADAPRKPTFLDRAKQTTTSIVEKGLGAQVKKTTGARSVYSPRLGLFVSPEEANSISSAADVVESFASVKQAARKDTWVNAPEDKSLELLVDSTGQAEFDIHRSFVSLDPDNYQWGISSPLIGRTDAGGLQAAAAARRKLVAKRDTLIEKGGDTKEIDSLTRKIEGFQVRVPKDGISGKKALAKTNQTVISGSDIEVAAREATKNTVYELGRNGMAPESIALKTNTTLDYVHHTLGGGEAATSNLANNRGAMQMEDIYNSWDMDGVAQQYTTQNRLLSLSDNGRLDSYNDYLVMLEGRSNQEMLDQWNNQFIRELLNNTQSEGFRDMMKQLGMHTPESQSDIDAMIQLAKESLGMVNDEIGKGRFFQSADFHARNMGDAGLVINKLGDTFVRSANKVNEKFQKMANGPLRRIAIDEEQRLGINTIVQALRAQKGTIVYRNRSFYIVDGKNQTPLQWEGKTITVPENWKDVDALVQVWEKRGAEIQAMRTTESKILGKANPVSTGLWIPPLDTRGKVVHFVQKRGPNGEGFTHQVVTGNTLEEVENKTNVLRQRYGDDISIISPTTRDQLQQRQYDKLKAEMFEGTIEAAESTQLKRGYGAEELFDTGLDTLRSIEDGFTSRTYSHMQRAQSLLFHDLLGALDVMEKNAKQAIDGANVGPVKKFLEGGVSNPTVMKQQLLGSNNLLSEYTVWDSGNKFVEGLIETGMHRLSKWSKSVQYSEINPKGKKARAMDIKWEKLEEGMERAGFPYPFKELAAINAERGFAHTASDPNARRVIAAANNFASTMALRFMETAHSLVNMISQPILTTSAIRGGNRSSFMGRQLLQQKTSIWETNATMMQGVAAMNNPAYHSIMKKAEGAGVLDPIVSEASAVIKAANINETGMLAAAERGMEKLERFMPVGKNQRGIGVAFSDGAEVLSRRAAFATGIVDGMKKYGFKLGADDTALYIYAKDFMDRAIGNYMPHQRPVAFQGSLGAAVGLFQTYMLTFAQNTWRHLETRDFAALGSVMMWQGSVFGIPSMPGMPQLSPLIGERFSDDNIDVKTGLFRMTDSKAGQDALVYGLPSALGSFIGLEGGGPNISGRGVVSPRLGIPGAEMVIGAGEAVLNVAGSMRQAGMEAGAVSLLEALSQQSVSRPLARSMELVTGYSVNRAGRTVAVEDDVWQAGSILARLIGTRPTDEVRMREAAHLNTFYGSLDREKRQTAIDDIRQHVRYGSLNGDAIQSAAGKYFGNKGSPQGFRSALNTAIQMDSQSLAGQLKQDLDWDSPFMRMVGDL